MLFLRNIAVVTAMVLSVPSTASVMRRQNNSSRILSESPALEPIVNGHDFAYYFEVKFQPLVDFDTDSCYSVPAMTMDGTASEGLSPSDDVGPCRPRSALDRTNVYVRGRCNRGWCAFVYAYYFQMDWAWSWPVSSYNHRHDWEHVVVWAKEGKVRGVSVSQHGGYESRVAEDQRLRFDYTPKEFPYPAWDPMPTSVAMHPKVVFHKDGARTHCFRFAKDSDDYEGQENERGVWIRGGLVSMLLMPSDWQDKFRSHGWGSAHMAWANEDDFTGHLVKSMPQEARDDGFDCAYDENPSLKGFPMDWKKWD
ncbi:hypothetical protein VDGE_08022 [Verticillium dahliae]|uniref:Secreted protein n=1 Tax=Verticillium dahliae TaxID=27337 RepID=A0A444S644_VERDA|nr:hypothetical protein VDGE_08022 [Verticillium dahliae]